MNTVQFLSMASDMYGDRVALVFRDRRLTYPQLLERVRRLASSLAGQGVGQGDKVAILQTNCNEYVEAYYAVSHLGGVFVPLNYRAKREELTHMLDNSDSTVLIAGNRYLPLVNEIRGDLPKLRTLITIESRQEGALHFDDLIRQGDPDGPPEADPGDHELNMLMYTSGTTAMPKGVMLSYGGFTEYIFSTVEPALDDDTGVTLLVAPLYHIAGASAILSAIYGGRRLVLQPQFEPHAWLEGVAREKATTAFLVPTMLKRVMDEPDFGKYELSSLQVLSYGGAPMPVPVIRRAVEMFPGVAFMNAFGQTETTSTVTILGPDDHRLEGAPEEVEKKLKRLASIGRRVGDVELQIQDDDGKPLPPNSVGEVCIKAPRTMEGYYKQEAATRETIRDGWIHTRDMGWLDEDGYLFLAGRKSDMIIRGGENIAPEEIEHVLHTNPNIEECAVIGVPDLEWGEKVMAIVVPKAGVKLSADDVIQYCKARMASFKAPEQVEFVDELPRNPMGKILKKDLRERYREGAGAI
jgi:acyl-CoA synthetase (AMP-forming)/AMP-acid ligase II